MKMLIVTQKVDQHDPVLGFFHRWLIEFAKNVDHLSVICLYEGSHNLPKNVQVYSLGKESGATRLQYIRRLVSLVCKLRNQYSAVLVHMNPEYIVLVGILWRLMKKKIGLWYMHKSVDLKLRIAEKLAHQIFTGTAESFRLPSSKLKVTGHGIDLEKIPMKDFFEEGKNKLVTVGRISPVKDYDTLIDAVQLLKEHGVHFSLDVIGGPATLEQEAYFEKLKDRVRIQNLDSEVNFVGPLSHDVVLRDLSGYDLFVHMSQTGSLDKAILEAMASGLLVISCNDSSRSLLSDFPDMYYPQGDAVELCAKIEQLLKHTAGERKARGIALRAIVEKNHNLTRLIPSILKRLS